MRKRRVKRVQKSKERKLPATRKQRRRVGLKKGKCAKGTETRTGDVFFQVRHGYRHLLSFSCPPLQFSNLRKAHQGSKGKDWKQTATGHKTNAAEGKRLTYYCALEGAKRFSRSWKMGSISFLFFGQFLWSTQSGDHSIGSCRRNGYHPQGDLAKSGYEPGMKYKSFF